MGSSDRMKAKLEALKAQAKGVQLTPAPQVKTPEPEVVAVKKAPKQIGGVKTLTVHDGKGGSRTFDLVEDDFQTEQTI
jgi:hypothetical protein